jgi:hypothetical protein
VRHTLTLLLLHLHLDQLCWWKGGDHPWHLWDYGFIGNGKEIFNVEALGHYNATSHFA